MLSSFFTSDRVCWQPENVTVLLTVSRFNRKKYRQMTLVNTQIKKAKPRSSDYKMADGGGMYSARQAKWSQVLASGLSVSGQAQDLGSGRLSTGRP